jgi:hypothetical protein
MGSVAVCITVGVSSLVEEAGTNSVAIAEVSRIAEDGASCSDNATDNDRRSVVVTGKVKAIGACCGGGVGMLVRAL